jgi:thioredoxin-related protein
MKKQLFSLLFSACATLAAVPLLAQKDASPAYPSSPYTGSIKWNNNFADAQQQARATGKPLFIFFTGSGWCSWCIKLEDQVLNRDEFIKMVSDRFIFVKADFPDYTEDAIMSSPYRPVMERYGVESFPTIVVTDSNGKQLFTTGYLAGGPINYANKLLNKLNESLEKQYYR